YNRGVLEVVFIDVGQGDSTLLKTPGGKFLLIDGGGSDFYDVGTRKLLPYLHHRGIRELFMVINTHPDTDHLQGLEKVVAELPVKCISLPASLVGADEYSNLKQAAQGRNIPLVPLQSGHELNIEKGLEMRVIYPDADKYAGRDYNEQSLVLDTRMGNFSILLTGDATTESLQKILNSRTVKPVTIVKVPHHGSKGSLLPEFYEKANPLYAVISSGKNNPFGHPHQSVLDMLEQNQIKILRTDLQGAITVETDGKGLKVNSFSNPE
ncbi:MAG: ComEC/Rec2 family competence protein, partial [Syntrophomonadaceae bacterium]|nr:ComEC/Rec2 family competence protein [Syntrophomonadaceae bacterium]